MIHVSLYLLSPALLSRHQLIVLLGMSVLQPGFLMYVPPSSLSPLLHVRTDSFHPRLVFRSTEMTDGMKEHYKKGGAITPEVAAPVFLDFVEKLEFKHSGEFWAPNGPK